MFKCLVGVFQRKKSRRANKLKRSVSESQLQAYNGGGGSLNDDNYDTMTICGPFEPPTGERVHRPRRKNAFNNGTRRRTAYDDLELDKRQSPRLVHKGKSDMRNTITLLARQATRLMSIENRTTEFGLYLLENDDTVYHYLDSLPPEKALHVVNQRVDVDVDGVYDRFTALGYAISLNNAELVQILLSKGADVNAKPNVLKYDENSYLCDIETPLQFAALFACSHELMCHLVDYSATLEDQNIMAHVEVLRYVARCTDADTARRLVDLVDNVNIVLPDGRLRRTALHLAVKSRNEVGVQMLLQNGADPNVADRTNKTPLLLACWNKVRVNIVRLLLEHGADVNKTDILSRTPLHYAVRYAQADSLRLLLDAGADVQACDSHGLSAFSYVFAKSNRKNFRQPVAEKPAVIVALLVDGAKDPVVVEKKHEFVKAAKELLMDKTIAQSVIVTFLSNNMIKHNDDSLLKFALKFGRMECCKWMLDHDYSVNSRDDDGWTPLHYSVLSKSKELVQLMQDHGADRDAVTAHGLTPLWLMLRYGLTQMAAEYIRDGCDVQACVKLTYVIQVPCDSVPLPKELFDPDEQRANPMQHARHSQRKLTLIEYCLRMRFYQVACLLAEAGAPADDMLAVVEPLLDELSEKDEADMPADAIKYLRDIITLISHE